MASTHVNHNIYITEVKTGKCLHSLVGHRRTPWCVTFHPTIPGLVASGCLDGEVRIWDLHVSIQGGAFSLQLCSVRCLLPPSQCGIFTNSSIVLLLQTSGTTSIFSLLLLNCGSITSIIAQNLNIARKNCYLQFEDNKTNIPSKNYALSRRFLF